MIGWGAALVSIATTAVIAGSSLYAGATPSNNGCFDACPSSTTDSSAQAGGITLLVVGIAAMGAGLPLLIIGAQKVPDRGDTGVATPTVRVGAGSGAVTWAF